MSFWKEFIQWQTEEALSKVYCSSPDTHKNSGDTIGKPALNIAKLSKSKNPINRLHAYLAIRELRESFANPEDSDAGVAQILTRLQGLDVIDEFLPRRRR